MLYRMHIPGYPLNRYVQSFFYFEGFMPEHNVERFLPDGNTEMIIDLTDSPKYIYDNVSLKEIQSCRNVWVSGVRTAPITIPSGRDNKMLVVTFRKGRSFPFYPLPVSELSDYVVDADLIYGEKISDLRSMLQTTPHIDARFQLVEKFLRSTAGDKINDDTAAACVDFAVNALVKDPQAQTMRRLSEQIGYSQKHFTALFKQRVGLTPKRYARILRFQQVVETLEGDFEHEWTQLAHHAGYFDQAHFINDFRIFSGFTPSEYLLKKSDTLNYVPVG